MTVFLIKESTVLAESKNILQIQDTILALLNNADSYKNIGDYEKTLDLIKKSHHLRKKFFPDTSIEIIKSNINMARAYLYLYEYKIALEYLHEAEKLCKINERDRTEEIGTIYTLFGRIYKQMGNYIEAQQYTKLAEEYLLKDKALNRNKIVSHYLLSADLERNLGNIEASLEYYEKSLEIIQKLDQNTDFLLNYYIGTALIYAKSDDYKKSIELQQIAINIAKSDSANYALRLAILYNNIGLDYLEIRQLNKAQHYLQNALQVYKNLGVKGSYLAELYESLGTLWFYKNDLQHSLRFYQKGLKITAPVMKVENVLENPNIEQIEAVLPALIILKSKTTCLKKLFFKENNLDYLDAAINTSLMAIELVEQVRNSYQSYESKLLTTKNEYEIFNITLDLLHVAYQYTGNKKYSELTYIVSEKSKSSVLLSVLSELDARQFGEIPDSLLEKEQSLSKSIAFYKENLYEEKQSLDPDSLKISIWEKYLFDVQREHNQLIAFFERNFPKYFNLKYDYSVTDFKKLQKKLPLRTSLIEYSISDSILFTFIINKHSFQLYEQNINKEFFEQLNQYINKFHRFDFSKQTLNDFTEFCWMSQLLYNILIAPVYNQISGNSLIIVPDGILSYLPFETLIKEIPDGIPSSQYRYLEYLINDYSVSYAYSATLYNQVSGTQKNLTNRRLLAFAPEYVKNAYENISGYAYLTRQQLRKDLFPIPGAIDEVEAIHQLISGDVFIGKDATEKNFKDTAEYYDILHLAMHTVIDNKNPLYSKLIFSISKDSVNDGLLNTYEVFDLTLNARMVVLSACSTGEGEFNNGEGVMSLARGFVYAGTPSIVMTMWEVEDRSGSELMKNFYKNLLKGQSKSKAMQNAKLASIRDARPENTHPFFWSSFVVMGNSHALYNNKKSQIIIAVASITLLLGLSVILIRVRRRIKQ